MEIRFLYAYVIFLFFFMLIIGLGGGSLIAEGYNITAPTPPSDPTADPFGTLVYVINNIALVTALMFTNPLAPTSLLMWIIVSPAIIVIGYIVLRLIRGGG